MAVQGFHDETTGNDCIVGGMILQCTASYSLSPWHNFVSDSTNWKDQDNQTPCEDTAGFLDSLPQNLFIDTLLSNNAKKIWSTGNSEVTLTGTPSYCPISCTLTIDNVVDSVTYNGETIFVTNQLEGWHIPKTIEFSSCDNSNPGSLVVAGSDEENTNRHCNTAGFLMACTADDTNSPWHQFVSDETNWTDSDGDPICVNSGGVLAVAGQDSFVRDLEALGAKQIWVAKQTVTLTGTPNV